MFFLESDDEALKKDDRSLKKVDEALRKGDRGLKKDDEDLKKDDGSSKKFARLKEPLKDSNPSTCHTTVKSNSNSHPFDISNFVCCVAVLSDAEKYDVLCKVWRPKIDYTFPVNTNSRRRFRHEWLTSFPWLRYSAAVDGGFCFNCVLFGGESTHNSTKLQRLFKFPLHARTASVEKLEDHNEKSPIHKTATVRAMHFKQVMENQRIAVDAQINTARQELIEKNRMCLSPIVGAILTCARQNIPLRGHRDDAHHYLGNDTSNPGNFIEILKYGASLGNLTDVVFESCPSNQTYRSKSIQNEIIEICGEMVTDKLVGDVKRARFFSVLADEATDCSNSEQMAMVLRFVDSCSMKIQKEFLGFIQCNDGLSGEALSVNISQFIGSLGLRMEECRDQGYDGVGNMAGKFSGVAARIQRNFDKAIYVHCGSHILNLCVASSCSLPVIRDMMDNMKAVSDFFNNSPKLTLVLQESLKMLLPLESHQKLINVCRTRWVAGIDGLQIFIQCYTAIIDALDRYTASGMKSAVEKFKFIVALVVVERCLKCTKPLTLQLQSASLHAGKACDKVSLLFLTLNELRSEMGKTHLNLYEVAVNLAEEANIAPSKPRTTGRQVHCENVPAESTSDYFKRVITIPFLDELIGQMESRFCEGNLDALDALNVMPDIVSQHVPVKDPFLLCGD
ncbi:52 kDa repressor of the inhibitor of the protein kinase-like [Dendronephthya gigantea]|uniref:52 kDa repressor of the inhibitor of the protein kinase-like n=1 Tax=Dendronephthya gigantea TaxID=151771 RepID=UPI00106DBC59|nr:52 kDa repressor of the inhibitor of the protein kinase-like [Dendronephthya gigantea]